MKAFERQKLHKNPLTKEAADQAWSDFLAAEVEANAECERICKAAFNQYKRKLDKLAKEVAR